MGEKKIGNGKRYKRIAAGVFVVLVVIALVFGVMAATKSGPFRKKGESEKEAATLTPLSYSSYAEAGGAEHQRVAIQEMSNDTMSRRVLFSVMDGDDQVVTVSAVESAFCAQLKDALQPLANLDDMPQVAAAVEKAALAFDEQLTSAMSGAIGAPGSTFSGAVLVARPNLPAKGFLINLGDSRAVALDEHGQVVQESRDHIFSDPLEDKRMRAAGWDGVQPSRGWTPIPVTRAFGYEASKKDSSGNYKGITAVISAQPDVTSLNETARFVVIATRALWRFVEPKELWEFMSPQNISGDAQVLAKKAEKRCKEMKSKGNCYTAVVVVDLRN